MKKVAIVGAGNAACISALSLYLQKKILEQEKNLLSQMMMSSK